MHDLTLLGLFPLEHSFGAYSMHNLKLLGPFTLEDLLYLKIKQHCGSFIAVKMLRPGQGVSSYSTVCSKVRTVLCALYLHKSSNCAVCFIFT